VAKRAKITEDDAANLLGGDALDRFTGTREGRTKPAKRATRKKAPPEEAEPELNRVKATFYLNREQVVALEELRLKHFKETGDKVDKSELVRKAIDLLASQ
jgi:hypothetical protein